MKRGFSAALLLVAVMALFSGCAYRGSVYGDAREPIVAPEIRESASPSPTPFDFGASRQRKPGAGENGSRNDSRSGGSADRFDGGAAT